MSLIGPISEFHVDRRTNGDGDFGKITRIPAVPEPSISDVSAYTHAYQYDPRIIFKRGRERSADTFKQ